MDKLTIIMLGAHQPLRAIKRFPTSCRHWCAQCLAATDETTTRAEEAVLPTRPDGYGGRCCGCERALEYTD